MTPNSSQAGAGNRRFAFHRLAALVGLACIAGGTAAQSSAQVMRLIVPFAAGSYTDSVARIVAPAMAEKLGNTIVIENRAGANGSLGADYVAKAAPDGQTVLVGGASVNTVNPNVFKTLPYDPVRDLLPVARIGILPFLLVINPTVPATNVAELVAYAKKNPGKLAYGTPNATTLVGMETFKRATGADITSVPYKSSPQAMADLVGNHVQVLIADFATAMPHIQSGKAKLLAVTMQKRSTLLPDTPPMSDTVKNFDLSAWTGLLLPGKAPQAAATRIHDALQAALTSPDVRTRLTGIGFDIQPLGPAEFGPFLRAEIKTWAGLVKDIGFQPE